MSGGNCPETPRQKMIGMMYLFLTAMLALNVSGELLQAFQLVDESILQSINAVQSKNDQLYAKFQNAEMTNEAKAKPKHDIAKEIGVKADSLFNHIDSLKMRMVRIVDSRPEATITDYIGGDNQDVAPQVMITERNGERSKILKDEINEYREFLLSHLTEEDTTISRSIIKSLSTESKKPSQKGEVERKWESQKFEHLPLSASFALLSSIQSNVRTTQADLIGHLLSEIDEGTFKFTAIDPIIMPTTGNVILKGSTFEADIFLAARDETQDPIVRVNGVEQPIQNGRGKYSVTTNKTGDFEYNAVIEVKDPMTGDPKPYSIKGSYQVIQPNVVISPTKMNVLYEGVDNPVEISVPGVPADRLSVKMTNVTQKRQGDEYILKPRSRSAGKKCIITVSADIDGKMHRLGSNEFRIKRVPDPYPIVANKRDGKIGKNLLKAQFGVIATMGPDFDFDLKFTVTSFTIAAIKQGFYKSETSKSYRFTDAQLDFIDGMGRGQKIFIEDIRAVGPDGTTRKLPTMTFTID